MTPDVVVDVGNTRIKWGWTSPADERMKTASLPPDDEPAWERQLSVMPFTGSLRWAVASVHPARLERFASWLVSRGDRAVVVEHDHVTLTIDVDEPRKVGIDRLLNAVAARHRCPDGQPVVIIDVGSAVTVDLLDEKDRFRGGAIFPGPRLMARALHEYTALLPDLPIHEVPGIDPPGRNTRDAITSGIMATMLGACQLLVDEYAALCPLPPSVLMTGGAVGYLIDYDFAPGIGVGGPFPLTLEGIRIVAEALS